MRKSQELLDRIRRRLSKGKLNIAWEDERELSSRLNDAEESERQILSELLSEAIYEIGYYCYKTKNLAGIKEAADKETALRKDFPESLDIVFNVLNIFKGLIILKYREKNYTDSDEIFGLIKGLSDEFPYDERVNSRCCACYVNLVSLCIKGEVPNKQSYKIADEMDKLVKRFPFQYEVGTAYGRVLASISLKLKKQPEKAGERYPKRLKKLDKEQRIDLPDDVREALSI